MAKKKETEKLAESYRCLVGGNLSNGQRFEAGDVVTIDDVTAPDLIALIEMGAVEEVV